MLCKALKKRSSIRATDSCCFVQSTILTAQKMKIFVKDFFSKCDPIRSLLRTWSHLLQKSSKENFTFYAWTFEEIFQKTDQGKRSYIERFAKTANGSQIIKYLHKMFDRRCLAGSRFWRNFNVSLEIRNWDQCTFRKEKFHTTFDKASLTI